MYFIDPHARFRIERGARHLVDLGARATGEFLAEGVREGDDLASLLNRLQRYQRCEPAILRVLGADKFQPRLRQVPR